jgi:hypothetical protein
MDSLLLAESDTLLEFYETNEELNIGRLTEIEAALAARDWAVAAALMATFEAETNIKENYMEYYGLFYNYYVNDSLDASDSTALSLLALQCPFSDGPAVYKARALFNLVFGVVMEYVDENCVPEGYSLRPANGKTNEMSALKQKENTRNEKYLSNKYVVYPNPTASSISIKSGRKTKYLDITIQDCLGSVVQKLRVESENPVLTMELNLRKGIYFVHLIDDRNARVTKKLVID